MSRDLSKKDESYLEGTSQLAALFGFAFSQSVDFGNSVLELSDRTYFTFASRLLASPAPLVFLR